MNLEWCTRLVPVLLLAAAHPVGASSKTLYTILPGTSRTTFHAHATGHDFSGTTTEVRGYLSFDPGRPGAAVSGEVRIQADTLDTGIGRRNRRMMELLEVQEHRDIVFTLDALEGFESSEMSRLEQATVSGVLEVRGVGYPLKTVVRLEEIGKDIVARGRFTLDIRSLGIEPPRILFVRMNPSVRLDFKVRFHPRE